MKNQNPINQIGIRFFFLNGNTELLVTIRQTLIQVSNNKVGELGLNRISVILFLG